MAEAWPGDRRRRMGWRALRRVGAALALAGAGFAAAPAANAQPAPAQQARDLSASARASVAEAMYASSATAAALERAADARLAAQRRTIEGLRARLRTLGGSNAALEAELAQAQERFVAELAARDRAYAQEVAVFRGALTRIASTPQGAAALRRFNAGDELGALAILDDLRAANDRGREARSRAQLEADNRRIALVSLEARARAHLGQAGGERTLMSDAQDAADAEADRLILSGDLAGARRRLTALVRAGGAGRTPAGTALLHDRLGDVLAALGDQAQALQHHRASLALRRTLAAQAPDDARAQRALGVALYKLARSAGGGVSWNDVAAHFEAMNQAGVLAERDAWALEEFRRRTRGGQSSLPAQGRDETTTFATKVWTQGGLDVVGTRQPPFGSTNAATGFWRLGRVGAAASGARRAKRISLAAAGISGLAR